MTTSPISATVSKFPVGSTAKLALPASIRPPGEITLVLLTASINAEGDKPELIPAFYLFLLVIHFVYTYPITRYSIRLEKRFAVKI